MNFNYYRKKTDYGADPYVADIEQKADQNTYFRTAVWTGQHLQMTLMCIPPYEDIGLEMHADTDQLVRIERGHAIVKMGKTKERLEFRQEMQKGDVAFIPAGAWHNIINTDWIPLKVSSVYAPPNHPKGTIHPTKADAEKEEY